MSGREAGDGGRDGEWGDDVQLGLKDRGEEKGGGIQDGGSGRVEGSIVVMAMRSLC